MFRHGSAMYRQCNKNRSPDQHSNPGTYRPHYQHKTNTILEYLYFANINPNGCDKIVMFLSFFKYSLSALYILSAAAIQLSASLYVIQRYLVLYSCWV
jgi:hypothetical protein